MTALLRLPPELRLQIYEILLSRHPYHIYIDEYFAKDCQPEWIQLKCLMKFDLPLASEILRLYWSTNTFMIPEANNFDAEAASWIDEHVKDNLKDLRHLEFGFSARCSSPRAGLSNPVCYNVVSIDIQRRSARMSKSGRRGDGCEHAHRALERLNTVLAKSLVDGQQIFAQNEFWALYKSCDG